MAALKRWETADALQDLPAVLANLDRLPLDERRRQLIHGLLAGNMFDWGAHAVVSKLEKGALTFETAGATVRRPAHLDDSAQFFERMDRQGPYRRAIIFVDNAGYDIVLGVFPFVRYLLQQGTEVVLAANLLPALNDITYRELLGLADAIAQNDDVVKQAIDSRCVPRARLRAHKGARAAHCLLRFWPARTDGHAQAAALCADGPGVAVHQLGAHLGAARPARARRRPGRHARHGPRHPHQLLRPVRRARTSAHEAAAEAEAHADRGGPSQPVFSGLAPHAGPHRFKCDALKIAVIKSEVVARQIGASLFDGIVRFEPAATLPTAAEAASSAAATAVL